MHCKIEMKIAKNQFTEALVKHYLILIAENCQIEMGIQDLAQYLPRFSALIAHNLTG
jgi:hypothetical protein